jgi:hypothetical protein
MELLQFHKQTNLNNVNRNSKAEDARNIMLDDPLEFDALSFSISCPRGHAAISKKNRV